MDAITHQPVASLDEDHSRQFVAVLDRAAGAVEPVDPCGPAPRDIHESAQSQVDQSIEQVVMLGQGYFDVRVQELATLVGLEARKRGSGPTGSLYAVLEYAVHRPAPEAWTDQRTARARLADLCERVVDDPSELRRAVTDADRSLEAARYIRQQSPLNPYSLPP